MHGYGMVGVIRQISICVRGFAINISFQFPFDSSLECPSARGHQTENR